MSRYYLMRTIPIFSRIAIFVLFFLLLLIVLPGCVQDTGISNNTVTKIPEQSIVFNDTMSNRVELSHTAERIVTSGDDLAEMLVAIGATDKIVGIADSRNNKRYLLSSLNPDVKNVGNMYSPDIETISQLQPDVLVAFAYSRPRNVDQIMALNCTTVFFNCEKLEELNDEAYAMGEMTGNREGAQKYIRFNKKYQDLVESRLANLTPDEILTVYGESGDYYVMTRIFCGGQIIEALHAQNVFGNRTDVYSPKLSPDWLLTKDPDVIIKMISQNQGVSFSSVHDSIKNRTGYGSLKAVRSNRVYIINDRLVSTPRSYVGLVYLAKALYPDRFADIDPDEVRHEYIREFHVANYTAEWIYPPFDSGVIPSGQGNRLSDQ